MRVLIFSCSTGGGHNSAGRAIKNELIKRNIDAFMVDPYALTHKDLDKLVGNAYIKLVRKKPKLFGFLYKLGDLYSKLPFKSPVYYINRRMVDVISNYLSENHFDLIITTHLYPGEILTYMKNKGIKIPPFIYVATDYTCIPFTEEVDADYFIIPSELNIEEFTQKGIDKNKILPIGIPVMDIFNETITKEEAKASLNLDLNKKYILLSGGSIGCGNIKKFIKVFYEYTKIHDEFNLIVICGNNDSLYNELSKNKDKHIILIQTTSNIYYYMKASEAYFSKPGGLSSTEAAVANSLLVHIAPIPGCETYNMEFFKKHKMAIAMNDDLTYIAKVLDNLDSDYINKMYQNQNKYINKYATRDLVDFIEDIINK